MKIKKNCFALVLISVFFVSLNSQAESDVVNQLDSLKARQNPISIKEDNTPFPDKGNSADKIKWYSKQLEIAGLIGDTNKTIALLKEIISIKEQNDPLSIASERDALALELAIAGFFKESLEIREKANAGKWKYEADKYFNTMAIARAKLLISNDINEAKKYLSEGQEILKKLGRDRQDPEFISIWLGTNFYTEAMIARAQGKYIESIELYRNAISRNKRYADNVERLAATYHYIANKERVLNGIDFQTVDLVKALQFSGKINEAEILLKQLLADQIKRGARLNVISNTATVMANQALNSGRYIEAGKIAERSNDLLKLAGIQSSSERYLYNQAVIISSQIGLGKWEEAYKNIQILTKAFDKSTDPPEVVLLQEASLAMARFGKAQEAVDYAKEAVRYRNERLGEKSSLSAEAEGMLAISLKANGNKEEALTHFRSAVPKLIDPSRDLTSAGLTFIRLKTRYIVEDYLDLLHTLNKLPSESTTDHSDLNALFTVTDFLRGSSLQKAIAGSSARLAASNPDLAKYVREEQDLAIIIADLQRKLVELFNGKMAAVDAQKFAAPIRKQIEESDEKRRNILKDIEKKYPDYAELVRPKSPSLYAVSKSLKPNESFIAIYAGLDQTFVIAVKADGKVGFTNAKVGESQISNMVASLRKSLDPGNVPLSEIPPFNFAASNNLYNFLFAPIKGVIDNSQVWIVSSSGSLATIPLSLLTTSSYKTAADPELLFAEYKKAPWLNQKAAIAYIPSASAMLSLRKLPAGAANRKSFLGVGDPQFGLQLAEAKGNTRNVAPSGSVALRNLSVKRNDENTQIAAESSQSFREDANLPKRELSMGQLVSIADNNIKQANNSDTTKEVVIDFPPLPDTRDEILTIAQSLGADTKADVILGADANRKKITSMKLNDRKVIAFATHGLIPGDVPGLNQPALALAYTKNQSESLLTLEDILRLKLDADWIVLSACNTAAGDSIGSDAASGLGRGFFYAGSRALLVTHWPVESESAKTLVTEIFSRYSKNTPRAIAVREAAQTLIDSPGYTDPNTKKLTYSYAHPMFWAPYALIGDADR